MRKTVFAIAIAMFSVPSWGNGTPTTETPKPQYFSVDLSLNPVSNSTSLSGAKANAGASSSSNSSSTSNSSGVSSADSTNNNSINNDAGSSRTYVAPAPSYATPLPGNLCPLGNSVAWSVGWNFFSYASSSVRTELECLERVLATLRPATPEVKVMEVIKEVVVKVPEIVYVDRVTEKPKAVVKKKAVPPCPEGEKQLKQCVKK